MNRIKFIYETRSNRIFMSVLSVCLLMISAISLLVESDLKDFSLGLMFGIVSVLLILFISLFTYKNFVYGNDKYLLVRINTFYFKTIVLDQIKSLEVNDNYLQIHLSNKTIQIHRAGIDPQDINRLQMIISKSVKTF